MNFTDFKSEELIDKLVLHTSGSTYGTKRGRIAKINKVTKTAFSIEGENGLFNLTNGRKKGLTGRANMSTINECELITDEQAEQLRAQWALKREKKTILEEITHKINTLSIEQLRAIKTIIDNG